MNSAMRYLVCLLKSLSGTSPGPGFHDCWLSVAPDTAHHLRDDYFVYRLDWVPSDRPEKLDGFKVICHKCRQDAMVVYDPKMW